MNSKLNLRKALSILSTLTVSAVLALGATGCVFTGSASVDTTDPVVVDDPGPAISTVSIDPGASMSASPGDGVGLFVSYDAGGHWTIFTTCDTAISGASCNFDVLVSADPRVIIENVEPADLNPSDRLMLNSDGSINLVADTDFGMNGFSFDADPGAMIEVDMLLDGVAQPRFVYAVSDGVLLEGVPTNPVDFDPAAP